MTFVLIHSTPDCCVREVHPKDNGHHASWEILLWSHRGNWVYKSCQQVLPICHCGSCSRRVNLYRNKGSDPFNLSYHFQMILIKRKTMCLSISGRSGLRNINIDRAIYSLPPALRPAKKFRLKVPFMLALPVLSNPSPPVVYLFGQLSPHHPPDPPHSTRSSASLKY